MVLKVRRKRIQSYSLEYRQLKPGFESDDDSDEWSCGTQTARADITLNDDNEKG